MRHRGFTSVARAARVFIAGTLVAGLFAVVGGATAAHAATCDTSWTSAGGGDWNTAGNWSAGVPTGSTNACITLVGTYTVTLGAQVSALSLSLGASSGTQTLSIQSSCGVFSQLSLGADSLIRPHGVVNITETGAACGDYWSRLTQSVGTLTDNGTIHVIAGGTSRYLTGAIANTGNITVDGFLHFNGTLTNTATVSVSTGGTLQVETGGFLNNGGTIAAVGTGTVFLQNTAYTQGAGTTSGSSTTPVQVNAGAIHYTGAGASTITQFGNPTAIDGDISAGQTLSLTARSGNYAIVNAATSWTNAGTINLTDILPNSGDYYAMLNTTSGTLNNTGTIHVDQGTVGSTSRYLYGNIANSGTLKIDKLVTTNGGTITNTGTVTILTGAQFTISNGAFLNNGGNVAGQGTGVLFATNSAAYTQGDGTTSGSRPVQISGGTIHYTGSGASKIYQYGNVTNIDGNIAAGQTLNVEAQCGLYARLYAAADWSNAGTINVTDNAPACGDYYAELNTTAGTLTNTGTIEYNAGNTSRYLSGNLANSGSFKVDATTVHTNGATFTNTGTVTVVTGGLLSVQGGAFLNNAGTVAASGTGEVFVTNSAAYTQGNGTTTGSSPTPIQMSGGTIHYTGTGASTITQYGNVTSIDGNIAAGQTLNIQSQCGQYARLDAGANWTNAGTINVSDSAVACGDYFAEINTIAGATLTNTGTIHFFAGNTTRYVTGNLANDGTLILDAGAAFTRQAGTITNDVTGTIETHIASTTSFGHIVGSSPIQLGGTLHIVTAYAPVNKDLVTLISGGGETGQFAAITGQALSGQRGWKPKYATGSTTLQVRKSADLNIIGSAPSPVGTGTQFSYTFTVGNAGPRPSGQLKLLSNLPGGVTFVSASPGCVNVAGQVTCTITSLGVGGSAVITITVTAGAPAPFTFNTASISSASTVDMNQVDNTAKVKVKIV